jgi:hypothetical protein
MTDDSVTGYLARGWSIVALHGVVGGVCTCDLGQACKNAGKHPLYRNWQKVPINDLGVWNAISGWRLARGLPTNVGLATGRPSGVFALDVDPKNGGLLTLQEYERAGRLLPPTWEQRTGGKGLHCLFTMPADFEPTNATGRLGAGLDIRGTGGQIVLAPSITDKGAYEVTRDAIPWAAPHWLLDDIRPLPYDRPAVVAHDPVTLDSRAAAYAVRARDAVLRELAQESSSRNSRAFVVACRLHELLNAGWLEYDATYDAYLAAAEQASGNKVDPFGQHEADGVWRNAAHRTMDKAAELPPDTWGGERLDFPQGPTAASGSSPPATDGFVFADPAPPGLHPSITGSPTSPIGLNLPAEFWGARPVLKQIQLAAHSRLVGADVVLHSVLTRLASLWPHQLKINNGIKDGACANLFSATVGPSGSGKTSGISVARSLLPRPPWLDRPAYADDRPLGTGEGIAEVYMGTKSVPKLEHGVPLQDLKGAVKTEKVRAQVIHNALMHADEGEALAKLIERSGSTVGETLRRAWVGGTIGQSNGRVETTRVIEQGRYSLGMLIGFQPETAQPLLADSAAGTPQRFLWCWASDPTIPDEDVPDPGGLRDVWPASQSDGNAWIIGAAVADLRPVTFDPAIIAEIKPEVRAVARGELVLPPLDSHRPLMLVKLSTLLAQLDGRRDVTTEDWRLARIVWDTSRRVQDHLVSFGQAMAGKAAADRRAAYSAQETEATLAVLEAREDRERHQVERVALAVTRRVQQEGALTAGAIRRVLNSRDRSLVVDALLVATERGWLGELDGTFVKGSTHV